MLPEEPATDRVYRLRPCNPDEGFYAERTDRNLGWITLKEQKLLRRKTVCIAGCGGMGGLLCSILVRLGVGEIRLADSEVFDVSNINRQFGARRASVGVSKAFETARMIRATCDDTTIVVYPQGIQPNTVGPFLEGADVVCDEIEFWAVGARILLHQKARQSGTSVFNCNTVGFGTRLFCYEPNGHTMEQTLGMTYAEALALQEKVQSGKATSAEILCVMRAVLTGLVPEIPEYGANTDEFSTVANAEERLTKELRAMIIATNPPMATGFLANHLLFHLLRDSGVKRDVQKPAAAPGYLYFDTGLHVAKVVERREVIHGG